METTHLLPTRTDVLVVDGLIYGEVLRRRITIGLPTYDIELEDGSVRTNLVAGRDFDLV